MDLTTVYGLLISVITALGGAGAWKFYESRAATKEKNENYLKETYKERIEKLELHLTDASLEKTKLRSEVLNLTSEVSRLRVKVEYLERENQVLLMRDSFKKQNL